MVAGGILGAQTVAFNSIGLVLRGFGYQTTRAIKGTLVAWLFAAFGLWINIHPSGDEIVSHVVSVSDLSVR